MNYRRILIGAVFILYIRWKKKQLKDGDTKLWWEFRLKGFLDETGRGWSRDAVINDF